ncbi:Homeodomain-like protein [Cynara cardunculus var. scolymus]|uniref:Homeodomain-like protein n=1 Tax=Cynara cardunculus var. scolymus TaxID=59895 RepID=A0A103XPL8_CYNCS|nr:Homeodomain-like protein [Cynara cardunculus var. scolymus]
MGKEDDMMMMTTTMRKGPWTEQEDVQLVSYVNMFGDRRWDFIAKVSDFVGHGIKRFKKELKWSRIARKLPGRTDNEIKNYWRTHTRKNAQEKKRVLSPSSSFSNSSSYSSICTSNPTIDSTPMTEFNQRSFYDTSGLEMVVITKGESDSNTMKSTTTSLNDVSEMQDGYNSMDEIWKDIDLLEDDGITPVFGTCSEIAPSPMWDYSLNALWMIDGLEETESNMFFPDNKRAI